MAIFDFIICFNAQQEKLRYPDRPVFFLEAPASGSREWYFSGEELKPGKAPQHSHSLLIAWDEKSSQWEIRTDRFGTLHCYHAHDGKRAAIGTFFQGVSAAASSRQLDWQALTGFFGFGFFPGDGTFFKDVKILRPASRYVFDSQGKLLKSGRYWNWKYEPDSKRTYAGTVDDFAALFEQIMEEQAGGGKVALPISGGLDSRSTVAALRNRIRQDPRDFWAYSYGYSDDSVETRIAEKVAKAAGLNFQKFTIGPYLFERMDGIFSALEGFQDVTQARQAFAAGEIRAHAGRVVAAHWGDVWLDSMGSEKKPEKSFEEAAFSKMAKRGREWLLENLCVPAGVRAREALRETISAEAGPYAGLADADFRLKAFKTDQWSFRWTLASLRMYRAAARPLLPFYDKRMGDFFASVPSEFVRGRRLQIDYLKKVSPALARVEWQPYGANLYEYKNFNTWLLPARILKKIARRFRPGKKFERNWEVQFLNPEGRRGLEDALMAHGRKIHEFVPAVKIRSLIEKLYQEASPETGYAVSMLLTFAVWLEKNRDARA